MVTTVEITLSDRTYDQAVASLEQRGDLNLLVENLLIQHLDEAIPFSLAEAKLGELYLHRAVYIHRFRVLTESIRQLDSLYLEQFEVNQEIRHLTLGVVARQVRVQQAIDQLDAAIAEHPQHCSRPVFPDCLEAFAQDLESVRGEA